MKEYYYNEDKFTGDCKDTVMKELCFNSELVKCFVVPNADYSSICYLLIENNFNHNFFVRTMTRCKWEDLKKEKITKNSDLPLIPTLKFNIKIDLHIGINSFIVINIIINI